MPGRRPSAPACAARRKLLKRATLLAAGGIAAAPALAAKRDDPRRSPLEPGDELVFPTWEYEDRLVRPADLELGAAPLLAYPRDPATGVVRERSRLNQVLVLRLDPAAFDADMRARAAGDIVAYSGLCTHTACAVSEWDADARTLLCPCHGSAFDPAQAGARRAGPAPRSLPGLPLERDGDRLLVAGPFTARVGAAT